MSLHFRNKIEEKLYWLSAEKTYEKMREAHYADFVEDIFDYHTAVKTRRDPYHERGWNNVKAEAYGIGHAYRRFSGFKGYINCSIEHSLAFDRINNELEYRDNDYPLVLTSCMDRFQLIQPKTNKIMIPLGCFFMPYAKSIYDEFTTTCIKKNLGKTLLVYPQHNNVNSFYEGEDEKKKDFIELVERIKVEHGFDTVIACMYFADIRNQTYREYERLGWQIVTAGPNTNYDFCDNARTILSLADHVLCMGTVSSLIQAAYLGIPSTYVLGRTEKRMADGRLNNPGQELGFDKLYQDCYRLFGEYHEELTEEQKAWCASWGGFDCDKSPEELRLILEYARALGKGTASDAKARRILSKKKYQAIRPYIEASLDMRGREL